MGFKLGIIGHRRNIEKVNEVVKIHFKNFDTTDIEFTNAEQIQKVCGYVKSLEDSLDGIIFTGKVPYNLINNAMFSKLPWVYIEHNHGQLQRTLLESTVIQGYDILNVSLDSYDEKTVYGAYREIGIDPDQLHLYISDMDIYNASFLENLKAFHEKNYYEHQVSFCMTGISSIYEHLTAQGIPCMILDPTVDTIKQTILNLKLKRKSRINEESQIVVLSIELDLANEYSLLNENEYQLMLEKMKIAEEIYLFAQRIQAAVVEVGFRGYLLFSTKNILEVETNNVQRLSVLNAISENTFSTVSIGIGYGVTAREAKYNANLGMQRAKKSGGNQAFLVYDNNYTGPIKAVEPEAAQDEYYIDDVFHRIAEASDVSINTIFKLHCIADQNKKDCFTPKELADLYGNSPRSMNRILEKLESSGYVKVVGKKVISGAGRPSRIVKILF